MLRMSPVPDLEDLVRSWDEYLLAEYAQTSREAYLKGLRRYREWLTTRGPNLATARSSDVRAWREHLRANYAAQTVNLWLSAVRRFYAFLIEEHNVQILNPAAGIRGATRRGQSQTLMRDELTSKEVWSVLESCDGSPIGRRDRAIISLMAYCALRTVEVQRADLAELGTMKGRSILWVRGKGRVEADNYVVLPVAGVLALESWLSVRGREPGPLFIGFGNRNRGERLSLRQFRRLVKSRYAAIGGVNGTKTTDGLRLSAISSAIRHGAKPLQVQAMARHRSVYTTLGYFDRIERTSNPAEDLVDYSPR